MSDRNGVAIQPCEIPPGAASKQKPGTAIKEEQHPAHSAQGLQAEMWAKFDEGWWHGLACEMYTEKRKYITDDHLKTRHHNTMVGMWMAAHAEGRPRCGAPPPPPPPPCRREGDFFDGID